ncbi:hypothetical protein [uncultured Gammaproteobacteria bacterium]|nr:hypothetical protein [uncultured Gammaproteobacteria bacterium]CAC9956444.1 hypothetical protein [uncultured Gammaproteobacteria bacterium]
MTVNLFLAIMLIKQSKMNILHVSLNTIIKNGHHPLTSILA